MSCQTGRSAMAANSVYDLLDKMRLFAANGAGVNQSVVPASADVMPGGGCILDRKLL